MNNILNRINEEICYDTIEQLKDENLMDDFFKQQSVKNSINLCKTLLQKTLCENSISEDEVYNITTSFINNYIHHLIPPGTKGVIRGNKFNNIIKNKINSFNLNPDQFKVSFEQVLEHFGERPDWIIEDVLHNKKIVGMNQIDLWSGGQQSNRGDKYVGSNSDTENIKLLAIVCSNPNITSNKTKKFKLFKKGFETNTICYINNLHNIIKTFFNINQYGIIETL